MLMSLFNSSCFGGTFDRDEEGTASVGVVASCDEDEEGGETSITFPTSDDSDGLLPEMKVKNTNEK